MPDDYAFLFLELPSLTVAFKKTLRKTYAKYMITDHHL